MPPDLAAQARPAALDPSAAAALVLLDRAAAELAIIGPFPDRHTADAWRPAHTSRPDTDRLVVPLHPAPVDSIG